MTQEEKIRDVSDALEKVLLDCDELCSECELDGAQHAEFCVLLNNAYNAGVNDERARAPSESGGK